MPSKLDEMHAFYSIVLKLKKGALAGFVDPAEVAQLDNAFHFWMNEYHKKEYSHMCIQHLSGMEEHEEEPQETEKQLQQLASLVDRIADQMLKLEEKVRDMEEVIGDNTYLARDNATAITVLGNDLSSVCTSVDDLRRDMRYLK